jgi:hypothetical protein
MELVSLLIGIAGLAFGVWQLVKSNRAESTLSRLLSELPGKMVEQLRMVQLPPEQSRTAKPNEVGGVERTAETTSPIISGQDHPDIPHVISYEDIDGDGRKELLIRYPQGAHGVALRVFDWDPEKHEFSETGSLWSETPNLEVKDFDGDGRVEIMIEEINWESGLPRAVAPRTTRFYRWKGESFEEFFRVTEQVIQQE